MTGISAAVVLGVGLLRRRPAVVSSLALPRRDPGGAMG